MNSELLKFGKLQRELIKCMEYLDETAKVLILSPYELEQVKEIKLLGLTQLLESFDIFKPNFNELIRVIEQRGSVEYFLSLYKDHYKPCQLTDELRDKYAKQILGEDIEKSNINVFIDENLYETRPVVYMIYKKKGIGIKNNGKLSEEETLKLIESKQIIINYSTVYKDYDDRPNFFCSIDECFDIEDERVVNFTIKNYPFLYRDIMNNLTVKKIEEDKKRYAENIRIGKQEISNKLADVKAHTI